MGLTYRQAGVDIDRGDELVERIKPLARMTRIPEVLADVGGFAGLCAIPAGIVDPILVSGTDGVGTKLKLAFQTGVHNTIGQDLVGMCVNDVLTCGARPLFFLDYFATGRLDIDVAESVVRGIANACKEVGCALIGGETAELPGLYEGKHYDLAGFCVGAVERDRLIDGTRVTPGDVILGLPSSGLHSNGYSLARRVLLDVMGKALDEPLLIDASGHSATVADVLLTPTKLYGKAIAALLASDVEVRAMAHITGGGLPLNLTRAFPPGTAALVDASTWREPAVFDLIRRGGPVAESELRLTFNMGIGFCVVVPPAQSERALALLAAAGEDASIIGHVVAGEGDVRFVGDAP